MVVLVGICLVKNSVFWERYIARVLDFTPSMNIMIDIYVILDFSLFFFCLKKSSARLLLGETRLIEASMEC